ncbi:MAG: integrase core domain-containing protein, partial [Elusimicrobia bacterium]|nr:integrase core domain-containing protein [Elusimicrobiota bacterium]
HIEAYRKKYNEERPHGALNGLSPSQFAQRHTAMLQTNATRIPQFNLV